MLLYKRLITVAKDEEQGRHLTQQELRLLLEGLSLSQPKAISKSLKGVLYGYYRILN